AIALPPARWISPTTCVRGSLRRPATTTCAPSAASIFAASRPMPLPPPVTIATCPSSRPIAPPQRRISEEYYCSGVREAGVHRGWPETGARRIGRRGGPRYGPPHPPRSERPGIPVALLDHPRVAHCCRGRRSATT